MSWFKVDDRLHSSRKLMRIPRRARHACLGVWTQAGSWCAAEETDGLIPQHMLDEWGVSKTHIEWLVKVELWMVASEDSDAAYAFKNWNDYQPTRKENEHKREKNREKLRHWRERNRVTDEDVTGLQTELHTGFVTEDVTGLVTPPPSRPVPSRPVPIKDSSKTDEEFDRWYARYPRKEAKAAARKAFAKARKDVDMDTLMAGLDKYAVSVKGKDRQYIALPASWLNAGRWEDEYVPSAPHASQNVPSMYAHFNQ